MFTLTAHWRQRLDERKYQALRALETGDFTYLHTDWALQSSRDVNTAEIARRTRAFGHFVEQVENNYVHACKAGPETITRIVEQIGQLSSRHSAQTWHNTIENDREWAKNNMVGVLDYSYGVLGGLIHNLDAPLQDTAVDVVLMMAHWVEKVFDMLLQSLSRMVDNIPKMMQGNRDALTGARESVSRAAQISTTWIQWFCRGGAATAAAAPTRAEATFHLRWREGRGLGAAAAAAALEYQAARHRLLGSQVETYGPTRGHRGGWTARLAVRSPALDYPELVDAGRAFVDVEAARSAPRPGWPSLPNPDAVYITDVSPAGSAAWA
ncbi:hypothetical protein GGS23DRAFT_513445 [Durotheca rogersii]|uniref:uncharacterized protein n=1 Tax=Durotheca rogersii TaxID=419775 RepID=UPI00221F5613|nr:uncharacterized protein GGS23DRAFT_513445 [Durotheca rogersii]KAI5863772.1 hypothetical protein GGS23DRAFT_513445 [Durotheca rogersii]